MPQTLTDLAFDHRTLNDPVMIEKLGGSQAHTYAQGLFRQHGRDISPDPDARKQLAHWSEVTHSRAPAGFSDRRSPATAEEGLDYVEKASPLAFISAASQPVPIDEISSPVAAQNWLAQEVQNLRRRMAISKELLAWGVLKGSFVCNPSTVPGSKVSFALTFNTTALTPLADWSNAGTKILSSELAAFEQTYHDACGEQIRKYVIDREVKKYIRQNTEVTNTLTNDPNPNNRLLALERVMGPAFGGFELDEYEFDVHSTKYDKSGTLTKYLGSDQLIALPAEERLSQVLGYAEGYGAIPREAIGSNPGSMGGRATQRGDYMYAYTNANPATLTLVMGCPILFVLLHPEAVGYTDDVTSTS